MEVKHLEVKRKENLVIFPVTQSGIRGLTECIFSIYFFAVKPDLFNSR